MDHRPRVDPDDRETLLLPENFDHYVGKNNEIRVLDFYVDSLDLKDLGFRHPKYEPAVEDPPCSPGDMLKLYLYGYVREIPSSCMLEEKTRINLEAIWLVRMMRPSYKSIAAFRKDYARQLRKVNRDFVLICGEIGLFGVEREAEADGRTGEYPEETLKKIDGRIEEYHRAMDRQDALEEEAGVGDPVKRKERAENIKRFTREMKERRKLKALERQSGDSRTSAAGEDAGPSGKRERGT